MRSKYKGRQSSQKLLTKQALRGGQQIRAGYRAWIDPVILPTCHMRALDLDGPACLEFELRRGMSLLNLNRRELDYVPSWDTQGIRVMD